MALTQIERTRRLREKRKGEGIIQVTVYIHEDDAGALKAYAAKLRNKRLAGSK